jgi:nitrite reductase/ring-hydroxylating ferredoxin subunit
MGGKVIKDLIITVKRSHYVIVFCMLTIVGGCSSDLTDDPIPPAIFPTKTIVVNLPENIALKSKGYAREYNDIGVRGVIVYCEDVGVYHAYERNCSFHPNEACATVNIDNSLLFMTDPCCGSTFDFNTGNPMGGAAWRPLREYSTSFDGSQLVITDDPVQ